MAEITEVYAIILAGTSMLLLLAASVIYFVSRQRRRFLLQQNQIQKIEHEKEQEILKAIIRAQEQERNRIATNLHDSVGAELSVLHLNLTKFIFLNNKETPLAQELKKDIENLDNTVKSVRSICHDLYPISLKNYGLIATFEELLDKLAGTGKITVEKKITISEAELPSNAEQKLNLLRVFQEVTHNILKYAACDKLVVTFSKKDQFVVINFSHNGSAFTNNEAEQQIKSGTGIGLQSIYNRLLLLDGVINYQTTNNLTEVSIKIPI